jgi:hypothetical protein
VGEEPLLPAGHQPLLPAALLLLSAALLLLLPFPLSHSIVPSSAWHLSHML